MNGSIGYTDEQESSDASEAVELYLLVKAARYLNVTVWQLAEMPSYWRNLALSCQVAEEKAEMRKQVKNPLAGL